MTQTAPTPMKRFRNLLIAASAATLAACATATPYQAASEPGGFDGYTQQMIENDRARVSFGGNSVTKRETIENYLLFKAAEMTLEKGFDHFVLQEREVEEDKRVRVTQNGFGGGFGGFGAFDPYFGYSFFGPRLGFSQAYAFNRFGGFNRGFGFGRRGFIGGFNDPFFNDIDVREITKYRAIADVKFGKGEGEDAPNVFNAREVIENLSGSITFPETDS